MARSKKNDVLQRAPLQHVALLRALPGVGDFLCCVPALRALRAALPEAQISLIGLPSAAALQQRFHRYVDKLLLFPGFSGIPEVSIDRARYPAQLAELQQQNFDLLIQMHGNGTFINEFVELVGAKVLAGFYLPGRSYCPDGTHFLPYPAAEPEVWRHLLLLEYLGIPLQGDHLEFPLGPADSDALHDALGGRPLAPYEYACVHPGAGDPGRRWSPELFAHVADELAAQGLQVVITGTQAETAVTAAVVSAMRHSPLDLTGRTTLGALAALVGKARLVICNDTGISHVAAALGTPSVVIFPGPASPGADPSGWPPLDRVRHRFIQPQANTPDMAAAVGIDPRSVLEQASQLLAWDWRSYA
ncbi:MAG: glycosyltransferase family 9 protein [Chloroflexota bacterium]